MRIYRHRSAPLAVLCLIPLLAHLPELTGLVSTDPRLFMSSLARYPNSGLLPGFPYIDSNVGVTTMALGGLAADSWLHGQIPWWNPYTGVGLPLASEMQPAAFLLPFILLLHFKAGYLYLKIAMQALTGLMTFGFLRSLRLGNWASLMGAILFQLNGTFAWYGDAPILPIAFLPMLFWALVRARDAARRGGQGGEPMIALAIAGSLVAGFPETAYLDGLLALGWAILCVSRLPESRRIAFARKVALGGVLGLALAAPALVPFLTDLQYTTIGDHEAATQSFFLRPQYAVALFMPYLFGLVRSSPYLSMDFWAKSGGYLGLIAPLLALAALVHQPNQRAVRRFFGVAAFIILGASSHLPGLVWFVNRIPGMANVQLYRYGLPSVEFACSALAAFALQDFVTAPAPRPWSRAIILFTAILAALLAATLHWAGFSLFTASELAICSCAALAFATVCLLLIWLATTPKLRPHFRPIATIAILMETMTFSLLPTLSGYTRPERITGIDQYLAAHQGLSRALSTDRTLFANYGAIVKLGMVQYVYLPVAQNWADYVRAHLDAGAAPTSWPFFATDAAVARAVTQHIAGLEAVGVRYVVAPTQANLFPPAADPHAPRRVFQADGKDLFELPDAAPYAEAGNCRLQVLDRQTMTADCQSPSTLIRRELFFPGWHVSVNGHKQILRQQGAIFQATDLPVGHATIIWWYTPPFARLMAILFFLGIAGLAACLRAEFYPRLPLPSAKTPS